MHTAGWPGEGLVLLRPAAVLDCIADTMMQRGTGRSELQDEDEAAAAAATTAADRSGRERVCAQGSHGIP